MGFMKNQDGSVSNGVSIEIGGKPISIDNPLQSKNVGTLRDSLSVLVPPSAYTTTTSDILVPPSGKSIVLHSILYTSSLAASTDTLVCIKKSGSSVLTESIFGYLFGLMPFIGSLGKSFPCPYKLPKDTALQTEYTNAGNFTGYLFILIDYEFV